MRDRGDDDRGGERRGYGYGRLEQAGAGPVDFRGRGPRGYKRSDERIKEDMSDRLADDPHVDASDIEVSVQGGEVTLSGTVDGRAVRRRAEDIAENVSGVIHVQNNLRLRQQEGGGERGADRMAAATSRAGSDATRSPGAPGGGGLVRTMPDSTDDAVTSGGAAPLGVAGMVAGGEAAGTPGGERGPQDDARRRGE